MTFKTQRASRRRVGEDVFLSAKPQRADAPCPPRRGAVGLRRCGKAIGAIIVVITCWLTVLVGITFASPPGRSLAIVGPTSQALAAVQQANGRVLSSSNYVTIARSDDPHFVTRLYTAGARLVLDADQSGGCSGLPPRSTRA